MNITKMGQSRQTSRVIFINNTNPGGNINHPEMGAQSGKPVE